MKLETVKESLDKLSEVVSFNYPATGWYFSSVALEDSFVFKNNRWVCTFMYWKRVIKLGGRMRFSDDCGQACPGLVEYGGFRELTDDGGEFIAETERFRKTRDLAQIYHEFSVETTPPAKEDYLYFETIEAMDTDREIEVINLFPDPTGLADLTTLSYYDSEENYERVITPAASGCQSLFTIPYHERSKKNPMGIIGLMEPLVRNFIPKDMIAFSLPANRFVEMVNNIEGSFLDKSFKSPLLV